MVLPIFCRVKVAYSNTSENRITFKTGSSKFGEILLTNFVPDFLKQRNIFNSQTMTLHVDERHINVAVCVTTRISAANIWV